MTRAGQTERKRLIANISRRLSPDGADDMPDLAKTVLHNANMEDLGVYAPAEVAAFVRMAGDILAKRPPGRHIIRITNPEIEGRSRVHRSITLIEILNDNMPFLVDSIIGELEAFNVEVRLVMHPVISVDRTAAGALTALHGIAGSASPVGAIRESLIHIHISRLTDKAERAGLKAKLDSLLSETRRVVTDWRAMRARVEQAIDDYRFGSAGFSEEDRNETIAFLEWLLDDNFTLLGIREYDFVGGRTRGELKRRDAPGLGLLGDPDVRVLRRGDQSFTTTPAIRAFLMRPEPLFVTKANTRSRVHRRVYMDYIGVKLHAGNGRLVGELRIIGLFTSTAYNRSIRAIPYLRKKIDRIVAMAGFDPHGHSGKALVNALESYPRDELFHIDDDTLHTFCFAILELLERPRIRVLIRPDEFDRYISAIVYVPRDRYNTDVRIAIGAYLADQFDGHVSSHFPAHPEGSSLTRVHFIIGRDEGRPPAIDPSALEKGIARIVRTWVDHLRHLLRTAAPANLARENIRRYQDAFPPTYREVFKADVAVNDITVFERLTADRPLAVEFHDAAGGTPAAAGLKLFHRGTPLSLSERVPILENMGFRVIAEQTYEIVPDGEGPHIYVHDMTLERGDGAAIDLDAVSARLSDCLMAVWYGRTDNDGFNGLVLAAGLVWRDVALVRALGHYLHQAGTPYSQRSMWEALRRYPDIAGLLVTFFHGRFDPDNRRARTAARASDALMAALESVETLDEDRVVRRFINLLDATVRTNFFQTDEHGNAKSEIVFKFDSQRIDGLPAPRPFREIYVYSPRLEGLHMRFGKVARGGLRWSDRPQDYRTEVLGLVKAQQVKNAVIVPVGSKGGFVAKALRPGLTRDAFLAEGQAVYRIFVSCLLDITDNLDGETVIPPERVVRYDDDDPYLVVAADKGTATFSDLANQIAIEHGFWLGDAFASGGSDGYDHKKMGITARGAWKAVTRHFREMDIDIGATPFTVAGVGDMSGDVFGNGMLLSPATRLVAAFDHRDIFLDPDPDPAISLAERRRLFETPRSTWQDYKRDLISRGGGVFSRREKSIALSKEIKDLLGLTVNKAAPQDLMRAILAADVDLLWFGGVGTFVKGPGERDDDVGDRANDAIRIAAEDIRAKVVGEGANLAMTQRARVAYGLLGGRCNSDAIDNSAGVNTSDIEVNIKIALGSEIRDGELTLARRNRLLKAMTNDVAKLVLVNNYAQTLAISLTERQGMSQFGLQHRLMQMLERQGRLDREVELLPDDTAMIDRQAAGEPLTRAEIGVLLAYVKITLFEDLLATDLVDDPAFSDILVRYFPTRMQTGHQTAIETHRLRREIVVTSLSNFMVNRCGATFVMQVADRTGARVDAIARSYLAAREAFGLREHNAQIDKLDNKVSGDVQLALYHEARDLVHGRTVWFLENASFADGITAAINTFRPAVEEMTACLDDQLPERLKRVVAERTQTFRAEGVPEDIAVATARMPIMADAVDICVAANVCAADFPSTAGVFFEVGERFRVARIEELAHRMPVTDYYDGLALDRALETLAGAHRRLTVSVMLHARGRGRFDAWLKDAGADAARTLDAVATITESEELTVSRVSVAADLLAEFIRDREASGRD